MLPSPRLGALLWPALVAAGTLLPFLTILLGRGTLVARDTARLYAPLRGLVVEALRAGSLPLWNPYEGAGVPLFAQALHGVLHPVSLVAALAGAGTDALILLYLLAASLGAFALARALGASPPASACAAVGFGLAGYTVSMAANLVFLAGAATAPWVLAALRHAGARPAPRWHLAASAGAVAAGAFSGEYQALAWAVALGLALAAEAGGGRGLARAAAGAALGAAVAAVQLVPSWVYLGRTSRVAASETLDLLMWPLEPWRILEWIAPGFLHHHGDAAPFLLLGGPAGAAVPFSQSVFVGGAVLLLAAAAGTRARAARLLLVAGAVFLWLALGHRLGAAQLSSLLPVWGAFRFSEKLMAPVTLCAAALCALGVDRIASEGAPRWLRRGALALLGACAAAALLAWLAPGPVERFFALVGNGPAEQPMFPLPGDAAARARAHLLTGMLHAVAALAGATGLLWLSRRHRPAWLAPAFAALVLAQSAAAVPFATRLAPPTGPGDALPSALAGTLPAPRIEIPFADGKRVPRIAGLTDEQVMARLGVASVNVAARVDNAMLYTGLVPRRWSNLHEALGDDRWRAWRRYAVTHAVVPPPSRPEDVALARAATAGGTLLGEDPLGVTVWALPHRPWAFFAERAVSLPTPYAVHDRLLAAIEQDDPTVFVETGAPVATGPGIVRSFERGREWLRIEGEAAGDALLVVNEAWAPGWRATIDGREAEVLAADILVRGVRWPAGRHVLEMTYDPPEVRWGLWISALGCCALVALSWPAWRAKGPS